MSLRGYAVVTVSRDAWLIVSVFLIDAVDGSFGSSWCAVSVVVTGWLRARSASAASPSRSTLERNVTSNAPVFAVAVWRDRWTA